jgi:uncharacterized metal-binding protein YceD (DUF177 family)
MAQVTQQVDLGQLALKSGGGTRFEASVPIGEFVFGAQRYELAEDPIEVTVDVSRTSSGYVIRLRGKDALNGPCMRCYGDYSLPLAIDHSEIHEPHLDEDLASEYIEGNEVDLAGLTRDAIGLLIPTSISSPIDENGVCTECTESAAQLAHARDTAAAETEREPDPRWAKLRELEL